MLLLCKTGDDLDEGFFSFGVLGLGVIWIVLSGFWDCLHFLSL